MITGKKITKTQDSLIIPLKSQKPPTKLSDQFKLNNKHQEKPASESKFHNNNAIERVAKSLKQKPGQ